MVKTKTHRLNFVQQVTVSNWLTQHLNAIQGRSWTTISELIKADLGIVISVTTLQNMASRLGLAIVPKETHSKSPVNQLWVKCHALEAEILTLKSAIADLQAFKKSFES